MFTAAEVSNAALIISTGITIYRPMVSASRAVFTVSILLQG